MDNSDYPRGREVKDLEGRPVRHIGGRLQDGAAKAGEKAEDHVQRGLGVRPEPGRSQEEQATTEEEE